jgi:hypothetical protein
MSFDHNNNYKDVACGGGGGGGFGKAAGSSNCYLYQGMFLCCTVREPQHAVCLRFGAHSLTLFFCQVSPLG